MSLPPNQYVIDVDYQMMAKKLHEDDEMVDQVDHPKHYGNANDPYEVIKVIRAWKLDFWLGNTVKYIARAGKKDPNKLIEDLEKASWYLRDKIDELKKAK